MLSHGGRTQGSSRSAVLSPQALPQEGRRRCGPCLSSPCDCAERDSHWDLEEPGGRRHGVLFAKRLPGGSSAGIFQGPWATTP